MIDDHGVPILGGPVPPPDEVATRAASIPLIVIRINPEGFLEAFVNVPPDGISILYQDADHIVKLHGLLQVAGALVETLLQDLPMSVSQGGEKPQ